jgi:hypothetical protein
MQGRVETMFLEIRVRVAVKSVDECELRQFCHVDVVL